MDEADPHSENDFGKNIIPTMLRDGQRLFTYTFDGYWKDVGTIESLWEANMALLEMPMPIDLYDKRWRIYARNPGMPCLLYTSHKSSLPGSTCCLEKTPASVSKQSVLPPERP